MAFQDWLLSRSVIFKVYRGSKCRHFTHSFLPRYTSKAETYDLLFINSPVDGHVRCSHFLGARSKAGVNSCAQVFVWVWSLFISFGDKPRSEWVIWQLQAKFIILDLVFHIEDDDGIAGRWRPEDSCRE